MKTLSTLAMAAAVAVILPTSSALAGETYVVDPAHAWVQFGIGHAGWSTARGKFSAIEGTIDFDKDDVTKSSVEITIDATSVDTNLEARDDHLLGPDFLNVEEFPEVTFNSTSIEQTGERTALVTGDMTMIGATREVVLDVTWNNEAALPWDATTIVSGFSATTSFNPVDFGMNKVAEFGLGPMMDVIIEVESQKQ